MNRSPKQLRQASQDRGYAGDPFVEELLDTVDELARQPMPIPSAAPVAPPAPPSKIPMALAAITSAAALALGFLYVRSLTTIADEQVARTRAEARVETTTSNGVEQTKVFARQVADLEAKAAALTSAIESAKNENQFLRQENAKLSGQMEYLRQENAKLSGQLESPKTGKN
jgi:septal ring factor EnvC (AmiA/AmiB activator)